MAKLVYSLVLADDVVAAVDELAARQGYNRSALVNHILAEYTSLTTPEAWNGRVLKALDYWASQQGLRVAGQSAASLTVRTALSYKYNPALSYTVEMRGDGTDLGRLRLTLRSQNDRVLEHFNRFFHLWEELEARYLPTPPAYSDQDVQPKRYQRTLRRPDLQEEETAKALAAYIATLDGSLKVFFQNLGDDLRAIKATESYYKKRLDSINGLNRL